MSWPDRWTMPASGGESSSGKTMARSGSEPNGVAPLSELPEAHPQDGAGERPDQPLLTIHAPLLMLLSKLREDHGLWGGPFLAHAARKHQSD